MRRPKGLPHGGGKTQASSPLPHDAGDSRRWVRRLEGTHVDWRPAEAVWRRTNHKEPSHRRNPEVGLRRSRERKEKIPVASGVWRRDCSSRWLVAASWPSGKQIEPLAGGLLERTRRWIEAEQEQIPFTMQGHPQRLRASVSLFLSSRWTL